MRVLSTFGFDPGNGPVINKQLLKQQSIRTVVRKLLHEVVKLSSVPIDPNLPPPVIKRPPPKVKQPPPPPRRRVGRDDIEMKKGDWLCPKCDFMNFAKNTTCLQCDAKRPKRELLPGEWECPECKFLNYRRNMACFHCECKRPPDEFLENNLQQQQRTPKQKFDKVANRSEVSNAWNFDFDDDESDGADVAAFEYADSRTRVEDSPLSGQAQGDFSGSEGDFQRVYRAKGYGGDVFEDAGYERPGTGFNDFVDEDDIDGYEIETQSHNPSWKSLASDDTIADPDEELPNDQRSGSVRSQASQSMRRRTALSEDDGPDFDTDEDLPVHPNWKSTHVAEAQHIRKNKVPRGLRKLNFGSDVSEDDEVDDGFSGSRASRPYRGGARFADRKPYKGRAVFDVENDLLSGSELENDGLSRISKRDNTETGRRGYNFKAHKNGHDKKISNDRGRRGQQFYGTTGGGPPKQQQRRFGRYDEGRDFCGLGDFRSGSPTQLRKGSDRYDKNRGSGEVRNNGRTLPKQQRRKQERRGGRQG